MLGMQGRAHAGVHENEEVWVKRVKHLATGAQKSLQAADPNYTGAITEAHLATLEDAIRDAVRARRSVYEGSKEMLLRIFKWVAYSGAICTVAAFVEHTVEHTANFFSSPHLCLIIASVDS
eukprot:scaffold23917_cov23-Tisochrysis_lutea.AAC.2